MSEYANRLDFVRRMSVSGESLEERVERTVEMVEAALLGTEPKLGIWDFADYLVAALATLTGDGDRARRAALAEYARRPVE